MKLSINIDSENDACLTKRNIVALLDKTVKKIKAAQVGDDGRILDINGNSVGTWEISK